MKQGSDGDGERDAETRADNKQSEKGQQRPR